MHRGTLSGSWRGEGDLLGMDGAVRGYPKVETWSRFQSSVVLRHRTRRESTLSTGTPLRQRAGPSENPGMGIGTDPVTTEGELEVSFDTHAQKSAQAGNQSHCKIGLVLYNTQTPVKTGIPYNKRLGTCLWRPEMQMSNQQTVVLLCLTKSAAMNEISFARIQRKERKTIIGTILSCDKNDLQPKPKWVS